jgi:hypothetical protein
MNITRDEKSSVLFLSHQSYIKKFLHHFNMMMQFLILLLLALQCPSTNGDFEYMYELHILLLLVLRCITWFVIILICHMLWVWWVDAWIILVKNIGRLFNEFLGTFEAHAMLVWKCFLCYLGRLLLFML